MSQTRKKILLGFAAFLTAVVPAFLGVQFYQRLPHEPLALGAPVPHLELEAVGDAGAWPQQGRRVLLLFSPSCSHCRQTIAQFTKLREIHPEWFSGEKSLHWAFISTADREETIGYARSNSWPIFFDATRSARRALHSVSVPYLVLVGENGRVLYRHNGERSLEQHETLINALYQSGTVPDVR